MKILEIPGMEQTATFCKDCSIDIQQARDELLGLIRANDPGQLIGEVPPEKSSSRRYAYDCSLMKTIGWGEYRGRFYINQYGPRKARIWRKETYPSREWAKRYKSGDPPMFMKIDNCVNRFGDDKAKPGGKPLYTRAHLNHVVGVAHVHDDEYPLANVDPSYEWIFGYPFWGECYVMIAWDLDLTERNLEYRWETKSTARRLGKSTHDLYTTASEAQKSFNDWMAGKIPEEDESPATTIGPSAQATSSVAASTIIPPTPEQYVTPSPDRYETPGPIVRSTETPLQGQNASSTLIQNGFTAPMNGPVATRQPPQYRSSALTGRLPGSLVSQPGNYGPASSSLHYGMGGQNRGFPQNGMQYGMQYGMNGQSGFPPYDYQANLTPPGGYHYRMARTPARRRPQYNAIRQTRSMTRANPPLSASHQYEQLRAMLEMQMEDQYGDGWETMVDGLSIG